MKPRSRATTATLGAVSIAVLAGCGNVAQKQGDPTQAGTKSSGTTGQSAAPARTITVITPSLTTGGQGTSTGTTTTGLPTGTTGVSGNAEQALPNTTALSGSTSAFGTTGSVFTPTDAGNLVANLPRPFEDASPWNTPILHAPLAAKSTALMTAAEFRYGVVTGAGSQSLSTLTTKKVQITKPLFINTKIWTDPIIPSDGGQAVTLVCRQVNLPPPQNDCGDGWDLPSLNIESSEFPKPSYDGWLTVYDTGTGEAYDFWRARFDAADTTLTYQFVRKWDINGPGFLTPNYVSARGSGLPLFAGEILPRDIVHGTIRHALAISVPGPASRFYVQPASSTDGNGNFNSLPEGARIRLKASFNIGAAIKKLPGGTNLIAARAIMTCLKTYGAIVVDRGAVPTLYALPNFNWDTPLRNSKGLLLSPDGKTVLPPAYQRSRYETPLLSGSVTKEIHLDDFEVVQLPQEIQFPPIGKSTVAGGVNGVNGQVPSGQAVQAGTNVTPTSKNSTVGTALP